MATPLVGDDNPRVQYTTIAAQTYYDIPFTFQDDDEIFVYLGDNVTPEDSADYTLAGANVTLGAGTIRMTPDTPYVTGVVVTIVRIPEIKRLTTFSLSGEWTPDNVNREFNNLVYMIQRINDQQTRSLTLAETDATIDLTMPSIPTPAQALLLGPTGITLATIATASEMAAAIAAAAIATSEADDAATDAAAAAASAAAAAASAASLSLPTPADPGDDGKALIASAGGWALNTSAMSAYALDAVVAKFGSKQAWSAVQRLGTVAVSYATPFAPDLSTAPWKLVGALTGAFDIDLPTNCLLDEIFVIETVQDGTGSRAVTIDAGYLNPPSAFAQTAGNRHWLVCKVTAVSGTTATEVLILNSINEDDF